jgi:hypothetical protein
MKTFQPSYLLRLALAAALPLAVGAVPAAETNDVADARPVLHLDVDVPPVWQPFLADDIADAFAARLVDTFRRQGFEGTVAHRFGRAQAEDVRPLLSIRLTEWRIDRTGTARCTFSATLVTETDERNLGLFSDLALFWHAPGGRWSLARRFEAASALEQAAEGALRDLYNRLARTEAVPGLRR